MTKCDHLILLILSVLSLSFSAFAKEGDLLSRLRQGTEDISQENCVPQLNNLAGILDNATRADYLGQIHSLGHDLFLDALFEIKVRTHKELRAFYQRGGLEKDCSVSARNFFRALRTTEDYVNAHFYHLHKDTTIFSDNSFDDGNPLVRRNPDFKNFNLMSDLKSGDVLLTRGNAYTSAAIASLGEFDTQFSHMSMVYKDPQGKLWTIEAHIEVGSFVRPIEDHINDKNFRTMVFRFDDEIAAARAAEFIFHKVKNASETTGNILYDFGFDQDENTSLFCSEVVSYSLSHVTHGEVNIPIFRSRLMERKPRFVSMLGITSQSSFVPADIEIDPRFQLISEWRNLARISDSLQKDAVLHAMYKWNEELGYNMIQASSKKSLLYRNIAWPLRRVPYLKKYFVNRMPLNMSRQLIGYFGVLESIGELLQSQLISPDAQSVSETGFPLLKSEMAKYLESVRLEDLRTKRRKLHRMYRPSKRAQGDH
jgi:hypothetical protein